MPKVQSFSYSTNLNNPSDVSIYALFSLWLLFVSLKLTGFEFLLLIQTEQVYSWCVKSAVSPQIFLHLPQRDYCKGLLLTFFMVALYRFFFFFKRHPSLGCHTVYYFLEISLPKISSIFAMSAYMFYLRKHNVHTPKMSFSKIHSKLWC